MKNHIITFFNGFSDDVVLRPTGRWKLVTNKYGEITIYVEHRKFLFFKEWVNEHRIKMDYIHEYIFECDK